jgi:riboflavin-specific deaminase-like protein
MPESTQPRIRNLEGLTTCLADAAAFRIAQGRPFVVLSYAQSVDGSIAGRNRERMQLSGPDSMRMTHMIRSLCDTILIGIGTVLADNPQLTVQEIQGRNPQPIVLDTHLRTPVASRLVARPDTRAWLIHGPEASPTRARDLMENGAEPMPCVIGVDGRIDLAALMRLLADQSVNSIMVEGGARVITSFVRQQLVDLLIVTISPKWIGGLPVVDGLDAKTEFDLHLVDPFFQPLGEDVILWARSTWSRQ